MGVESTLKENEMKIRQISFRNCFFSFYFCIFDISYGL